MTAGHATSFDQWAADYDRYRPGYPAALFEAVTNRLALPPRPQVVDLGAGTGRATFAMIARGWKVTAVEPGERMLAVLRERAAKSGAELSVVDASAEATGIPQASCDLATAAQAFHWFDRPRAVAEMARIIRPGGGVALFWNVRDATRSSLVNDYERLIERFFGDAGIGQYLENGRTAEAEANRRAFAASDAFEALTFTELSHELDTSAEEFIGMAFTASYVRALSTEDQELFRRQVQDLLAHHRVSDDRFALPYRIDLWTAQRAFR